ncbi:MAG: SDR family NAD(P)-dependent oxidoreductase [Flavobacteriaceae bacterium]|nr:SDR family NAD(P)-dependent oxidoreductase [Flavobacteriaceae bacterium]
MKRILITGACGSIGSALVAKLLRESNIVCAFDNNEDKLFHLNKLFSNDKNLKIFFGDIKDKERLFQALNGIDEVYHCAALKHVELSEYNPFESIKTNVIGTQNIIESSIKRGVKKILVTSSDKAVNPSGIMGASKLLSEKLTINSNSYTGSDKIKMGCVRFGNVWNTNGSIGPIFRDQILNSSNISLTDRKMTRFFISIENAVELCVNACSNLIGGETFVSNMGAISIGDIATEFLKYGKKSKIIVTGSKAGEKLYEELFTEVESKRTFSFRSMYVIIPDSLDHNSTRFKKLNEKYNNGNPISTALRSDSLNIKKIKINELVKEIMNE